MNEEEKRLDEALRTIREECKKQNIKYGFKDNKEMLIKKLNA